jgi:hypothetical protein
MAEQKVSLPLASARGMLFAVDVGKLAGVIRDRSAVRL